MVGPNNDDNNFTKTICSICYEDLKPIVEDLQSISICGHVFHELCLQQWFEYCTNAKKQSCPVCKQGCTKKNVGRLYFQSVGDPVITQCENPRINRDDQEHSAEVLRIEVKRLEAKVSAFNSALELQQKEVKQLTDELQTCKEQLSKEEKLKTDALRQRESLQLMLETKSSDLLKSTMECSNLQEKNLALVKELAALKLVTDCNLEEEEIVKLASIGHEANSQDTIDVLKKSLVIRNKSCKELMTKCNTLGRGEARSLRKLEKAKGKIVKLKIRVQELETAVETKENELLRSLKASKNKDCNDVPLPGVNRCTKCSSEIKNSTVGHKDQYPNFVINLDDDGDDNPFEVTKNGSIYSTVNNLKDDGCLNYDEHRREKSQEFDTMAHSSKEGSHLKFGSSKQPNSDFEVDIMQQADDRFGSSSFAGPGNGHPASKEASGLRLQNIRQIQPSSHSNPDGSAPIPLAEPGNESYSGDRCFAGGLLGPDGANRYLGKWCKRAQSSAGGNGNGSLIAVGADGRGGKVKVLRSINHSNMDTDKSVVSAKRFKPGGKSSSLQTQGSLQIEHFFGKARS